jgi:hypothetical protein
LRQRVPCSATVLGDVCERGFLVEDFGLSLNLMLACAAKIVQGGPLACLRAISDAYEGGTTLRTFRRQCACLRCQVGCRVQATASLNSSAAIRLRTSGAPDGRNQATQ